MTQRGALTVNLPSENPFAEARPRAAGRVESRVGGQAGGRTGGGRRLQRANTYDVPDRMDDDDDDGYDSRRGTVTVLPSENPFSRGDPDRAGRNGHQLGARPNARVPNRARRYEDEDEIDEGGRGVTLLPTHNPFAARASRHIPRVMEPVDEPTEPEPEDEEEPSDYFSPAPVPRRASERAARRTSHWDREPSLERQRLGNPRNQLRAPPEDDRLVISFVTPPGSDNEPVRRPSSATSDTDSYTAPIHPHRPRSERSASPGPGPLSRAHNRDHHRDHHDRHHHHHHHHQDGHCRQCLHIPIPPWQPPFPMPPADWSGYGAPRPYSPAPPYPYGRPLYANIPDLPSLLDQCRVPYPPVPVAPVAFLRDLRQNGSGPSSPLSAVPVPVPAGMPPNLEEWKNILQLFAKSESGMLMPMLQAQEFSSSHIDRVFRRLSNIVQVRFGERQGNEIVNRVHLVPRGRLAMGTVMASNPKIDVDLVIPSDFILRRWNVNASETDDQRPKTIVDALELNPTSINRGEVEDAKLHWVFRAIWEQLNGSADGFIFPGGRDESERYLPKDWCSLYKESKLKESNRLRIITLGGVQMRINIFVKVSLSLYGQDMIVGVDQSSARSAGKYQLIKTIRTPGVPLSEPALSPNLRTAILMLCWSQQVLKAPPLLSPVRASHFHLALTALQKLPPTDDLYIPPSSHTERFSLYGAAKAMVKIIRFLSTAYESSGIAIVGAPIPGPSSGALGAALPYTFPLSSCTLMDALYIQASSNPLSMQAMIKCLQLASAQFELAEKALAVLNLDPTSIAKDVAGKVTAAVGDKAAAVAADATGKLATAAVEGLADALKPQPGGASSQVAAPVPAMGPKPTSVPVPAAKGDTGDEPTAETDGPGATSSTGGAQMTDVDAAKAKDELESKTKAEPAAEAKDVAKPAAVEAPGAAPAPPAGSPAQKKQVPPVAGGSVKAGAVQSPRNDSAGGAGRPPPGGPPKPNAPRPK